MKSSASFIRLQIAEDAKNALEKQARRHNMSQTELASRLVMWIVRQPQVVQATVLNNIKTDLEEELAHVLRDAARAGAAPPPAAAGGGKGLPPKKARTSRR